MIRNKILSRFIVVTLTAALLLVSGSRAIRVSALADPVAPAIAPIFDTQVYQLQDYIDHGGLTDPQYDIFMMLAGMYALAQSGSQAYKLRDPFEYESGVWNWLKSMGVKMYNSVISLIPDSGVMPITGQYYSTIPFKNAASLYVATLMGIAKKAETYDTVEEFKEDVASGSTYLPWNMDIQKGMNSVFGIYGGIYEWQFDSSPFLSNVEYKDLHFSGLMLEEFQDFLDLMDEPHVRYNNYESTSAYNTVWAGPFFQTYTNLFIDTDDHTFGLYNSAGQYLSSYSGYSGHQNLYYYQGSGFSFSQNSTIDSLFIGLRNYNPYNYNTYLQLVYDIYNNVLPYTGYSTLYLFLEDFVQHVYVGTNWLDKREIFNLTDLNFDEPEIPNDLDDYYSVPEDKTYYIDIHDLIPDLVNNTDLLNIILDHLVDPDGIEVHDTDLIKITTSIYNLLRETSNTPALPVDLNDIAEYTDNSYLDVVKERARRGGNELAALVAFWHNCDPEIIYVLFGAGITVLVGAFIGKWGHS